LLSARTNVVAPKIKQEIVHIAHEKKYEELVQQLYKREGSVIIFSKTKYGSEKMATKLCRDGFEADALHGDLRQNQRTKVMNNFRRKNFRILVATDIAARGLDVPHIEHVINYDLPQVAEDYIHRMGRTARAGAEGSALCFHLARRKPINGGRSKDCLILRPQGPERKEQGRKEQDRHDHKPHGKRARIASAPFQRASALCKNGCLRAVVFRARALSAGAGSIRSRAYCRMSFGQLFMIDYRLHAG
jgi:ATP-dependent RNA helicase DeaD